MTLEVFGRAFKIHGCDPFTQLHFWKLYGIDFPLDDGLDKGQHKERGIALINIIKIRVGYPALQRVR
jgi:hypothetical protein